MIVPSITTLVLGFAVMAVLAVADWYLWRTAPEMPYPLAPTGPDFAEVEEAPFKKVA